MYPINIDSRYGEAGNLPGNLLPEYRDITLHDVRISGGGKIWIHGYSNEHRTELTLDGVMLADPQTAKYSYSIDHADIHLGPGPVNLKTEGTDSTLSGTAGSGSLGSCEDKFVPFPHP
jgi:polygalacturonase